MVALTTDLSQFTPQYGSNNNSLPIGKYKVIIENTKLVPTKAGNANRLVIEMRVVEGQLSNALVNDGLNIQHPDPQTSRIANQQLAAYAAVTGRPGCRDTVEMHNVPFIIEIGPQKDQPEYTEVKRLFDLNGNPPGQGSVQPQQAAAVAPPPQGFAPVGGFPPQQSAPTAGWVAPQQAQLQAAWGQQPPAPAQETPPVQQAPWVQPGAPAAPAQQGWVPAPGGTAPGWGPR